MASVEGVWAKDIEEAFEEALAVYPPCGRRKIILSDEGKMYGRNELIARYIKMRTGKTRTRKQVSSHIQVLSRKRGREQQKAEQAAMQAQGTPARGVGGGMAPISYSFLSPGSQLMPPSARPFMPNFMPEQGKKTGAPQADGAALLYSSLANPSLAQALQKMGGLKFILVDLLATLEMRHETAETGPSTITHPIAEIKDLDFSAQFDKVDIRQMFPRFPGLQQLYHRGVKDCFFLVKLWIDINMPASGYYGVSSKYLSQRSGAIKCSSKLFAHGKQIAEKIQVAYAVIGDAGLYVYCFDRSPLCDSAISLLERLRTLPDRQHMNSLLNEFAVLQTVTDRETHEVLFAVAFMFEVSEGEGTHCQIYRLGE